MKFPLTRWFWRAATALWCCLIFFLSSQSNPPVPGFFDKIPFADKLAHAALYGALAAFAHLSMRDNSESSPRLRTLLIAVAFAAFYGVTDEFHQRFIPGRTPDILDWFADISGASLSAASFYAASLRRK